MLDFFKDFLFKEKQLLVQLELCPISEIIGIVNASGIGAGRVGGQELYTLTIKFDAWRVSNGYLKAKPLHIIRKVTKEELADIREKIKAETIVKINARVAEKSVSDEQDALFEEFIEVVSNDNELNNYLEELKNPVTYDDDIFGTLTFNRKLSWYSGKISWNKKSVDLNLPVDELDDIKLSLQVAKTLLENRKIWNNRISEYAVKELLELKNDSWLEEDEREVTAKQFKTRMKLEAITVYPDEEFEFWHHDGDLFWGHSILISGNLMDGPNHADIPG